MPKFEEQGSDGAAERSVKYMPILRVCLFLVTNFDSFPDIATMEALQEKEAT